MRKPAWDCAFDLREQLCLDTLLIGNLASSPRRKINFPAPNSHSGTDLPSPNTSARHPNSFYFIALFQRFPTIP